MNVTQLVFSWPREPQYSCEPDDYNGWAIEDYSLEMSDIPMQIGDTRNWENQVWRVAAIDDYSPQGETSLTFREVILTLDGEVPQRDPWKKGDARLMYVCISGEDFVFGWPERCEFFPQIGSEAPQLEGWQVSAIHAFKAAQPSPKYYAQVLICWCAPTGAQISREMVTSA